MHIDRCLTMLAAVWCLLCTAAVARAQQPGDIIVIRDTVQLTANERPIGKLDKGTILKVNAVRGEWLQVTDRKDVWVPKSRTVPHLESLAVFSQLLQERPQDPKPLLRRANIHALRKEFEESLADLTEYLKLQPSDGTVRYMRADLLAKMGRTEEAIEEFGQFLQMAPNHFYAHYQRGLLHLRKREYDAAILDFNKSLTQSSSFAPAYAARGQAWAARHEYEKAAFDFEQCLRLDPPNLEANRHLAWLHATCPDPRFRDGKKAVLKATRVCDDSKWENPDHLRVMAAAYAEMGEFDSAVRTQKKAIDLAPTPEARSSEEFFLNFYTDRQPYRDQPRDATAP